MIRELRKADINKVADIWLDTNIKTHYFISAQYWKSNFELVKELLLQATVYVYEDKQEIQGFIGLSDEYIEGIFVSAEIQSQGIGKILLNYVKWKRNKLLLNVYQKNTRAISFYQREGFEIQCNGIDEATGERDYVMAWQRKQAASSLQRSEYPMSKYLIQPQSGIRIDVNKGQKIEIIDVDGGQVADFFAEIKGTHDEYVSPSVLQTVLENVVVQAINTLLGDKSTYQAQLQQNIAKVIRSAQQNTADGINEKLQELQKELLKKANNKEAYDEIADEIFKLREQREKCTVDTAARDAQIARINELQDFIKQQPAHLEAFDEALVKRWLERIIVWDDHFTVELKSGLKIEIDE